MKTVNYIVAFGIVFFLSINLLHSQWIRPDKQQKDDNLERAHSFVYKDGFSSQLTEEEKRKLAEAERIKEEKEKEEKAKIRIEQEYAAYLSGGISTLKYKTTIGNDKYGLGGAIGGDYKFFLSKSVGIGIGLEIAMYNAKTSFNQFDYQVPAKDISGVNFEFRSNIRNYTEKQSAYFLNIPVMVQYQKTAFKDNQYYIAVGGKIGIPIKGKYSTNKTTYVNTGYYSAEDVEYTDHDFLGFGSYDRKMKGDIDFNIAFIASIEAGIKWKLTETKFLYTGAYFDYGLNDISKDKGTKQLVKYNAQTPKNFTGSSILTSKDVRQGTKDRFVDKVTPMAVGLKIKLAFGKKSKPKTEKEILEVPLLTDRDEELRDENASLLATEEAMDLFTEILLDAKLNKELADGLVKELVNKNWSHENIERVSKFAKMLIDKGVEPKEAAQYAITLVERKVSDSEAEQLINEYAREYNERKQQAEIQKALDAKLKAELDARLKAEELERIQKLKEQYPQYETIEQIEQVIAEATDIILTPISLYALNQVQLSKKQQQELDEKIKVLKAHPHLNIQTVGHTCSLGNHEVNMRISKARAANVKAYMVAKGIRADRITVLPEGKTHLIHKNDNLEQQRRENRRVELLVSK